MLNETNDYGWRHAADLDAAPPDAAYAFVCDGEISWYSADEGGVYHLPGKEIDSDTAADLREWLAEEVC